MIQSQSPPRCYLCGFAFSQEAIQKFLGQPASPVVLPPTLDVLRPRGRKPHEVSIEVEHVMPVTSGGQAGDNLRLACGWCNRAKSSKTSIYDAAFTSRNPSGGAPLVLAGELQYELPEPFWVVRIIAIQRHCQADGCNATISNSELRITLKDFSGSPNPTNLRAVCPRHDPIATERFRNSALVKAMWT
nr:HNH endonuclease [Brevundimonas variabilis]